MLHVNVRHHHHHHYHNVSTESVTKIR